MHGNVASLINAFWPPTERRKVMIRDGERREKNPAPKHLDFSQWSWDIGRVRTPLLTGRSWCRQVHSTSLRPCLLEGIDAHQFFGEPSASCRRWCLRHSCVRVDPLVIANIPYLEVWTYLPSACLSLIFLILKCERIFRLPVYLRNSLPYLYRM